MATQAEDDGKIGVRVRRWSTTTHAVVLFVVLPLTIAVLFTAMRSGFAAVLPAPKGLLVWVLLVLPAWWAAQLGSAAVHKILRPWLPPLWLVCLLGSIVQALALSPYYRALFDWGESISASGRLHGEWPLPEFSVAYVAALLWSIVPGASVWTAVNYYYDRVLDVPRFRYPEHTTVAAANLLSVPADLAQADGPVQGPPAAIADAAGSGTVGSIASLARSRLAASAEIRALTAEEHYVRVYTDRGADLVRARFSDVLVELGAVTAGMQVHRSWWVRVDRVRAAHERGRTCELDLGDGLRVPVSLAFRKAVLSRLPRRAQ